MVNLNCVSFLWQTKGIDGASCCNCDILLPVDREGHRRSVDFSAHLEVPQSLARRRIKRDEVTLRITGEEQASCG